MSVDGDRLFALLPAHHRLRDGEDGPLRALTAAIGRELAVMAAATEQLYDDLFIETCADALIPYIGDLVALPPLASAPGQEGLARAEVAHAIALRRRKGTLAAIEAAARDATGWSARGVEYFRTLATTQYMQHARLDASATASVRDSTLRERIGGPFDTAPRSIDVRRIASGRGRHAIGNIGLFVWPISAHRRTATPLVAIDDRRFRMSPLGQDIALYHRAIAEDAIDTLAGPLNVPDPLRRRALALDPALYGIAPDGYVLGLALYTDGAMILADRIRACRLDDDGAGWANMPTEAGIVAIDPERGRIALGPDILPTALTATWHEGFGAEIGGGEYPRALPAPHRDEAIVRVPADHPNLAAALAAIDGNGTVLIEGPGPYLLPATIAVTGSITIAAAPGHRPLLTIATALDVTGEDNARFALHGVLVAGGAVRVPDAPGNALAGVTIGHSTLVPGLHPNPDGTAGDPGAASLVVGIATTLTIDRSIMGGILTHDRATVSATDSIVDATATDRAAVIGGTLSLTGCTVIGRVTARAVGTVSDSLIVATGPSPTFAAERRQEGCVRYSALPADARAPRRFHCLPDTTGGPTPRLLSYRYGSPLYARLSPDSDRRLLSGASDEGEIGAYHHVGATRRLANLAVRLAEHLPAGLEGGIIQRIGTRP